MPDSDPDPDADRGPGQDPHPDPGSGPEDPAVLIAHTVAGSSWADADALRDAIRERRPGIDLRVARTPSETAAAVGGADALLVTRLPTDLLDRAPDLRWIQALSSGVDFLDLEAVADRGIALTNAAGVHAEPIAEQVLAYVLTFERNLHRGMAQQARGVWERYEGGEVRGKTLGIVGLGAIGSRVAEYGRAFGMEVIGTKRDPSEAPPAADEVYGPDGLGDVLRAADYLVLACPLTERTRGLIGREELAVLDEAAVLVNVARGAVVEEAALTYALQQGGLRGAALDVFEEEPLPAESVLWDLSNVILTPHMAGSTPEKLARIADIVVDNYDAVAAGRLGELENRVV